jgi:DNA ligase 1
LTKKSLSVRIQTGEKMKEKILETLNELVEKLKETSSLNKKKEILKNYTSLKGILGLIYDPMLMFNVSSKNLIKNKDLIKETDIDLFSLLISLYKRDVTGNSAIALINGFIKNNEEYKDLIYDIIDKNLKVRIDVKMLNSVFPKLIKEFTVELANKIEKYSDEPNFTKNELYFISRKIDGGRLIAIKKGDKVELFSRTGKEFTTLDILKEEIVKNVKEDVCVLDGEICILKENGDEDFSAVMKELRKKDHQIKNPHYKLFNILSLEGFLNGLEKTRFSDRYNKLKTVVTENKFLSVLEQKVIRCKEELEKEINEVPKEWEGLMLRANSYYEGKRTRNLLKIKKFSDAEYKVIELEMGKMRVLIDGVEEEVDVLSSVIIEHKGYRVNVGSGFSIEERRNYFLNPDKIKDKIITVKYFEESENKKGEKSLRFPTVKTVYNNGREI